MNFKALSLILIFGQLEPMFAVKKEATVQTFAIIYLKDDTAEKRAEVKHAYELLHKSLSYRYAEEERARIEANTIKRIYIGNANQVHRY